MRRSVPSAISRYALASIVLAGVTIAGGLQHAPGRAAAAAPVTLTFYDGGLYSTYADNDLKAIVSQYQKLHSNVTIKFIPYNGNYVTDISTALAGGTAADIVVPTAMQQIWTDVAKGYWEDLTPYYNQPDPYLPEHESLAKALLPSALSSMRFYDGKYYVLGTTSVDGAFFYNKRIFAKAGIKNTPATWDQFIADLKAIKAAGYIPIEGPLADTAYDEPMPVLLTAIEAQVMGKTIKQLDLNHDGTVDVRELALGMEKHVYSASNPEFQEALHLYASLVPYMERGATGVSEQAARNIFSAGRAAILYDGLWVGSGFDTAKPPVDWGAFPVPRVTSASSKFAYPGTHGTGVYGPGTAIAFAIPVTTVKHGHLSQVLDFLYYLMSYKNTDILTKSSASTSLLKGAHNDPRYQVFSEISAHLSPFAGAEETFPPQWAVLRQQVFIDYLTGQKSWNDMLTAMQKSMDTNAAVVLKTYHLK
ncbi:MAG TPA: extracellular solute-binding protein [Chloroflexota bacterium]|nr:extracellular solute-binding protein [Chloroflexota bacterium]